MIYSTWLKHISSNATTDVQHGIMDKDLDEDDDENKVEKDEGSPSVNRVSIRNYVNIFFFSTFTT